jgi:hypothetical protein
MVRPSPMSIRPAKSPLVETEVPDDGAEVSAVPLLAQLLGGLGCKNAHWRGWWQC